MEMLSFDDVKSTKPAEMHGDLHVTQDGFYFLAFRKVSGWVLALQVNMGLLGVWLAHRAYKKRKAEMADWRAEHGDRYVDDLVAELDDSWAVLGKDIRIIKSRFVSPGVIIEDLDGTKFSVETKKDQWKQIQDFAKQQNWPVK
jgi:hypothetical protein